MNRPLSSGRISASGASLGYPKISFKCRLAAMVDVRSGWSVPIYTPSRTASKSPASAAARRSTPLPGRFRSRGMRMALSGLTGPLLFDCGTDVADRRTRRMHLHRLLRHVEADGAFHAVLRPLGDVAVCAAFLDETILVAAVAA